MNDILELMKNLEFTEYEAKAYLALLEKSPLSGYAVSLHSGVPRSKIYEVLNTMEARGDVYASHEAPVLYTPLSPDELIAQKKRKAEETFKVAEKALAQYPFSAPNRDNIWNITGHDAIVGRVKEMVKKAETRILLEIWKEEAAEIKNELFDASSRGVEILIVAYGDLSIDFAQVYRHDNSDDITAEYGGRWVVASIDDNEILAGIVSLGDESRAAWTKHPGLIMPITEVIIHDIYIMEMLEKHRNILEDSFGPNLIRLRKQFNFGPTGKTFAEKLGLVR